MASLPVCGLLRRCRLKGLALAFCCTLVLGSLGAEVPTAPPSGGRFLRRQLPGKKETLLSKGPGFFRSAGLRGGVEEEALGELGDNGAKADSSLATSPFTDNMANRFTMLDNLEPVAPMDRLHAAMGADSADGHYLDPMYVPEYLTPDAFPVVAGNGCNCSLPTKKDEKIECTCGKKGEKDHYVWLKETPVVGTNNYTLTPADITYRGGNYWGPKTRDGLVAPADVLPADRYPIQALADRVWPLPASANKDRLPIRYARYMDQVQDRALECDTVSERCTVPCKPGDDVIAFLGNLELKGKIVKTFAGNAAEVTLVPTLAVDNKETADCPLEATCTIHRHCKGSKPHCVNPKDKESTNWAGVMFKHYECPPDTKVCKTVSQVIMATMLKKGGKACKAAPR